MRLTELTDDELVAFISLARIVVRADLEFSEDEEDALEAFGEQVGLARWKVVVARAMNENTSREQAMEAGRSVSRAEARKTIHEALKSLAGADELVPAEQAILDEIIVMWRQTS